MGIRILYIISVTMLLQVITLSGRAQNLPEEKVDITIKQFERRGEMLYIHFTLDMSKMNIKSRQAFSYTPIVSSTTKTANFPNIVLRGSNNYRSYIRRNALMRIQEPPPSSYYEAVKAFGRNSKTLDYEYVIPYENWMKNSKLEIKNEMSACGDTINLGTETFGSPAIGKGAQGTSLSRRRITGFVGDLNIINKQKGGEVFRIYFPSNGMKIDKRYLSNAKELSRLRGFIKTMQKSSDFNISKILVVGFASIGGMYTDNEILSYARARSTSLYLSKSIKVRNSLIDAYFGGEDWNDLKSLVVKYNMPDKTEILDIINNEKIRADKINMLRDLNGGETYKYMGVHFFPKLQYVYIKVYVNKK